MNTPYKRLGVVLLAILTIFIVMGTGYLYINFTDEYIVIALTLIFSLVLLSIFGFILKDVYESTHERAKKLGL